MLKSTRERFPKKKRSSLSRYVVRSKVERHLPHFKVYRAIQRGLDREVELRVFVVKTTDRAKRLKRFEREYKILSRLDHPFILKILDLGTTRDRAFYVTDFRNALCLSDLIAERRAPLDYEEVLLMARQVGSALAHIHSRKVLHRDLGPNTVFFDRDNSFYYIGAFSQSKGLADQGITSMGVPFLSPLTVTPELKNRRPIDERTDLYLLGACLYFALTGRNPMPVDRKDVDSAVFDGFDVVNVKEFAAGIPPGVDRLVRSLLMNDPSKRPSSCSSFLKSLARLEIKLKGRQDVHRAKTRVIAKLADARLARRQSEDSIENKADDHSRGPNLRDLWECLREIPLVYKAAALSALVPVSMFYYALFADDTDFVRLKRPTEKPGIIASITAGLTGSKSDTLISLNEQVLNISSKTTTSTFMERWSLLAKWRRQFPQKQRNRILSFDKLLNAKIAFRRDSRYGCSDLDKLLEQARQHTGRDIKG